MLSVDRIFSRKFDVKCGLFMFIFYSFISAFAYAYIWFASFIKAVNNEIDEVIVTSRAVVIVLALNIWYISFQYELIYYELFLHISIALSLITWLMIVYVSVKLKRAILKLFSKYSIQRNVNIMLCVLFPIFYQFYLISSVIKTFKKFNRLTNGNIDTETISI